MLHSSLLILARLGRQRIGTTIFLLKAAHWCTMPTMTRPVQWCLLHRLTSREERFLSTLDQTVACPNSNETGHLD